MRVLLAVVFAVAACDEPAAPPPPAPRVQAASAEKAVHECRDACEQNAILAHSSDVVLRACRANCDARLGAAALPPHEVPSRITRSAPAHAPPPVRAR